VAFVVQINALVYELYGSKEEEIGVVRGLVMNETRVVPLLGVGEPIGLKSATNFTN
jgi:hypothetical protein